MKLLIKINGIYSIETLGKMIFKIGEIENQLKKNDPNTVVSIEVEIS